MKILPSIILLTGLLLSLQVAAEDPNYDTSTRIITFPRMTVDLEDTYIKGQLRLNLNGTWEILAIEPEPESELNLTGNWRDSSSGVIFPNFSHGIECIADFDVSFL